MYLKFKKVIGKNFLSISNNLLEYEFNKGFINIIGDNGSGKSAIIDLITWTLYGKPFRKIKKSNILNKQNNKNCYGEVHFNVGNKSIAVKRGIKPNLFDIEVDGVPLKKLSHESDYQKTLDKLIGVEYDLFKQIIVLSTTKTATNFIDMSAQEKRNTISSIFSLSYVDKLLKVSKLKLTDSKVDLKVNIVARDSKWDETKTLKGLYSKKLENSDIVCQQQQLADIKKDGIIKSSRVTELSENIRLIKEEGIALVLESDEVKKELDNFTEINSKLSSHRYSLQPLTDKLKEITDTCPTCGSVLNVESIKKSRDSIQLEIDNVESHINNLTLKLKGQSEVQNRLNVLTQSCANLQADAEKDISDKRLLESELNTLMTTAQLIQGNMESSEDDIATLKESVDKSQAEYSAISVQMNDIQERIDNLEIITKQILSDSGFKSYYINKYLPIVNDYINTNMADLGLPFTFMFDAEFNFELYSTLNRTDFEYGQLSEGQKKKLDISITLSFINIMKDISRWDSNLLIFDELLDSGLDKKSTENVINGLRELFALDFKHLIIISHKIENDTLFDNVLEAELKNGFSDYKWAR